MLQPPGHLGLLEEASQALGVAVATGLEELQRHVAIQLGVAGQEDLAQGPRGMEAQVAILGPRGGRLPARDVVESASVPGVDPRVDHEGVEPPQQGDATAQLLGQLGAGGAQFLGREALALLAQLFPAQQ